MNDENRIRRVRARARQRGYELTKPRGKGSKGRDLFRLWGRTAQFMSWPMTLAEAAEWVEEFTTDESNVIWRTAEDAAAKLRYRSDELRAEADRLQKEAWKVIRIDHTGILAERRAMRAVSA